MKIKYLAAVIPALLSVMTPLAHAGAVASAVINITSFSLVDTSGNPVGLSGITLFPNQARVTSASAQVNGVEAAGIHAVGPNPHQVNGSNTSDVKYRCAGDCSAGTAALYGGSFENNVSAQLNGPATRTYALGDALISGAINDPVTPFAGLTRADASGVAPTVLGAGTSNIQNSGSISFDVLVGTSFTGGLALTANTWFAVWSDALAGVSSAADAGYGWNITVSRLSGGTGTFSSMNWVPDELNDTDGSVDGQNLVSYAQNLNINNVGGSLVRTYEEGAIYRFVINQSSTASVQVVSTVPEPASLALTGLALLGAAGFSRRRRQA